MEASSSSSVIKSWIIPNGVDPETAFKIEVKIDGFWNKQDDGKKVYVKGKMLRWVVDSDRFSLCDFNSDLLGVLSWGRCQGPKLWIIDKNDGIETSLASESQIPDMFKMYEKERVILIHVVVCDLDVDSNCSGSNPTPVQSFPNIEIGSQSQAESTNIAMSQSDDLDHYGHVGLDDEYLYMSDLDDGFDQSNRGVTKEVTKEVLTDSDSIALSSFLEEPTVECPVPDEPIMTYDPEDPKIEVGASFPNVVEFRKALRHFAIKKEFEFLTIKTDTKRFIGRCKESSCPWRIHASLVKDNKSFTVKKLPHDHTCPSTTMIDGKMASQAWISERVTDWLKKNPSAGAIDVKKKLQDDYHVKVTYNKAWEGRLAALNQIHGSWEEGFAMLYNFKCEVEKISSGSIIEISDERVGNNKVRFSKIFVALKPCIDGFLQGCRPYLGVDSTHLTGKYRGQLASACGVDGHNWLYPIVYGVFDLETTENWKWFLTQLKRAIGTPPGLAISSDAGKGLCAAISSVFPHSEHRECMRHLMENFKKRFHGEDVAKHMKYASRAYTREECQSHLEMVKKLAPTVVGYLESNHKLLWCRSHFSEMCKCEYENNNISECFNNWIKAYKGLHVVDLLDQIRQMIMEKFDVRRKVGAKLQGVVLPNVIKELNAISRNTGNSRVCRGGDDYAEVSGVDGNGKIWRNVVELDKKQCACRQWQLSGKPCMHAIKFICSLRGARIEDYVDDYYSLEKFRMAYAGKIPALNDKSKWQKAEIDFEVWPPQSKRPPGRPRNQRIPGCLEPNKRRRQCKRCKGFGHQARTCKEDDPEAVANKRYLGVHNKPNLKSKLRKRRRGSNNDCSDE